jgi:uncharacterized protein YkwD
MKKITFGLLTCACLFSNNAFSATDCDNQQILKLDSCVGDSVDQEETTLYNLVNEYRVEKGLSPISLSPALSLVANRHVRDLQENAGSLTHSWSNCAYNSNDSSTYFCMWEAPQRLGTSYTGNGYENAYGSSGSATATDALAGWKQSPAHNDTILNQSIWKDVTWNALGVGIYQGYAVIWFGEKTDDSSTLTEQLSQTIAQEDRILELYSAYFNRAADAQGFGFWKKSFNSYYGTAQAATDTEKEELALQRITSDMSGSDEYKALYPDSLSSVDFIDTIYTNLLDRPSDLDGLNFWSGHIDKGSMSKEQAILNMIAGAKGNNSTQGLIDKILISNKTDISKYFAQTLGSDNIELAETAFSTVTDNVETIEATKIILNSALKITDSTPTNSTPTDPTPINPTTPTDPTTSPTISSDEQVILDYHNRVRADVGVQPLKWSPKVAVAAQSWVNQLATTSCNLQHSGNGYGENMYWASGRSDLVSAAERWEIEKINYLNSSGETGHYTQMVWRNSTELGCASARCSDGATLVSCNYNPPGNDPRQKPY